MTDGQGLELFATLDTLHRIRDFVGDEGAALGMAAEPLADMQLVVDEAITNIVLHGYRGQGGTVSVRIEPEGDGVRIIIRDQATPFEPSHIPSPDLNRPLTQRPYGGMGVFLIHKLTDEVRHYTLEQGNEMRLLKRGVLPG